jgi:ABC-type multidrug transport system fused ATPase/permease subunit
MANAINLISDIFLLLVLSIMAVFFQPQVAILLFLLTVVSSLVLHFFLNTRARVLGKEDADFSISANMKILESLAIYREIFVHNRREFYATEVEKLRAKSSSTQAEIAFLPSISRYVVEASMLVGALTISAAQFILFDVATAVTALTIFLAAGSRLAPALLRVQQGSLGIRNALGGVSSTLTLISDLNSQNHNLLTRSKPGIEHFGTLVPRIEITNLWLKYPGSEKFSLRDVNLVIPERKVVAIVGPSAAGKTSLVDVLLGIITPSKGDVKISSLSPIQAINQWPDAISYVPQSVYVANTSLRKNIAIGIADCETDDNKVLDAIDKAQLSDLVRILPEGLDSELGEEGNTLSGGQRQRLGIARALYSDPQIIVLDEATSALDGETEKLVADAISTMRESATIILVAHRLSTVRSADLVCYLEDGELVATGTFEEVRRAVPKFNQQANLMGL